MPEINAAQKGIAESAGLDPETLRMVLESVSSLRTRLLTPRAISEYDREGLFPTEHLRMLFSSDIGIQLPFIPEEFGGIGGGAKDACLVCHEMGSICLGVATSVFAVLLALEPILAHGTKEQKHKWVTRVAEKGEIAAYAVTEPEAGSNLAALKTSATPVPDKDQGIRGYRISGTKQFISNGSIADFYTVLAKTPEGPSFFIVEKGVDGFTQGKPESKHGIRASDTASLRFTDVWVDHDRMVGMVPGKGLSQANQVFAATRLMVAAMTLGAAAASLNIVMEYGKSRIQFHTPLVEKQGYTQRFIVSHAAGLAAAAAYTEKAAVRADCREKDLETESAIAKLLASDFGIHCADDAVQALGGYGYMREYGVEKIRRDIRITSIYEGTTEVLESMVSMMRWKKWRRTKKTFYKKLQDEVLEKDPSSRAGSRFAALALGFTDQAVEMADTYDLHRIQPVMFALSRMTAWAESAKTFTEKSVWMNKNDIPDAKIHLMLSGLYAKKACEKTALLLLLILENLEQSGGANPVLAKNIQNALGSSLRNVLGKTQQAGKLLLQADKPFSLFHFPGTAL